MLLASEKAQKSVQTGFTLVYAYVKLSNSVNLQDVNIFLEDFFCKILNRLYKCSLNNLNTYNDQNYPGIDLGDETEGLAFQITSTDTRKKIEKTVTRFETYKLFEKYNHLRVLIISVQKPKYKPFSTNGKYTFDNQDVLILNDLYKQIISMGDVVIEEVNNILEKSLDPVKKYLKDNNQTVEAVLFKDLFQAFTQGIIDQSDTNDKFEEEDNSDLNIKKKRFEDFWKFIKETYIAIYDSKREKMYELVQSGFAEEAQIKVREYLKFESRKSLFETKEDPIKAIESLTKKMISDFQLDFVSETEIQYFLYYQLYQCCVFPNPGNI